MQCGENHIEKPGEGGCITADNPAEEAFNRQELETKGYVCPKNIFHEDLQLACSDCENYKEKKCRVFFKKKE